MLLVRCVEPTSCRGLKSARERRLPSVMGSKRFKANKGGGGGERGEWDPSVNQRRPSLLAVSQPMTAHTEINNIRTCDFELGRGKGGASSRDTRQKKFEMFVLFLLVIRPQTTAAAMTVRWMWESTWKYIGFRVRDKKVMHNGECPKFA
ncbi:hypothetical protein PoB_002599700 [Plakobranchus ocellatus]|uniref:Uncharacterized protein n=1 Tax=Plakobranchus ocellatus TaxID=259542 RepID=A0AAV3ZXU2_9GAST|nr:hypothetical protein PoB_002599700 [Plakobranchus ocellatus]